MSRRIGNVIEIPQTPERRIRIIELSKELCDEWGPVEFLKFLWQVSGTYTDNIHN